MVLEGIVFKFLEDLPFCFKKTNLSKLASDKFVRFGTKISPAVLKRRSHAAEDGKALLYSMYQINEFVIFFIFEH